MAKKKQAQRAEDDRPFFSATTFWRTYETKKSKRNYLMVSYYRNGKRTTAEKISEETGVDLVVLEYFAINSSSDFNRLIYSNSEDNSLSISIDLKDFLDVFFGYTSLEDETAIEYLGKINLFITDGERDDTPFISDVNIEIDRKNKLMYFDFSKDFEKQEGGIKFTRGKTEFAIYES